MTLNAALPSRVRVDSEAAMERLGGQLAGKLAGGCVIFLSGDLGAGKTTLVRGLLRALGYRDVVVSPTFTLLETYSAGEATVVHIDLYRLENSSELEQLAIRDYLEEQSVLLVEWAERARDSLPNPDCEVHISIDQDSRRTVSLEHFTETGRHLCSG